MIEVKVVGIVLFVVGVFDERAAGCVADKICITLMREGS